MGHPIRGGTLLDVLPALAAEGLTEGSRGSGTTLWPEDAELPTQDRPALALVLVPASAPSSRTSDEPGSGPDAPADDTTWVFPFARPLPPGDGDNQALAVTTTDGSVRYDVSFALDWADGDTAVNRNEAVALASCTGCTTVAVAFQVVLLVGSVDVVVPQNTAVAVNYACVECVTRALATQLVVTLDGPLDAEGQDALAEIWSELQDFAGEVPGLSLAEIRDRLTEYEDRIDDPATTEDTDGGADDTAATTAATTAAPSPTSSTPSETSSPSTTAPTTSAEPTATSTSESAAGSSTTG